MIEGERGGRKRGMMGGEAAEGEGKGRKGKKKVLEEE